MQGEARLNIKQFFVDMTRDEYEYPIPSEDAQEILNKLCIGPIVEKNVTISNLKDSYGDWMSFSETTND
jgi:CYTH domain-containing protein